MSLARLAAATTTTLSVHAGRPLPVARAVVVGVPMAALLIYLWLTRERRARRR